MRNVNRRGRRLTQRGISLLESVVALGVMSIGLLGLARFQAQSLAQATEVQGRGAATRLADELLNLATVDPAHPACYTVPAQGTCTSDVARDLVSAWTQRVQQALPAPAAATSDFDTLSGQLTVVLTWASREPGATRQVRMVTHVQP